MNFITITPVELDPNGIIPKIEHILNNRETKYLNEVRDLAITADDTQIENLEKLLEVASAVHMVHRLLLHYFLIGKKTKSHIFLQQIEMQLPLLIIMAKAYVSASKSFAEGSPIGDALGPMVVAKLVREITQDNPPAYEDISENTILQKTTFEGRILYFIRAKGPGGTVGKTGTAIKKVIEQHSDEIVRIITIDAGIKFEQDLYKKEYFTEEISADIKTEQKSDWFDIYGTVRFGEFEIPFIQLKHRFFQLCFNNVEVFTGLSFG